MRIKQFGVAAGLLLTAWVAVSALPSHVVDGDLYLGKWAGTYEGGDTTGNFQLAFERGGDGKLIATISVAQDGGGGGQDYSVKMKSAAFVGDKFSGTYDPPGDNQSEINLKGTFSANAGSGDWSLGAKDKPSSPAVASGTWKLAKP
jgi:hypothetical protein